MPQRKSITKTIIVPKRWLGGTDSPRRESGGGEIGFQRRHPASALPSHTQTNNPTHPPHPTLHPPPPPSKRLVIRVNTVLMFRFKIWRALHQLGVERRGVKVSKAMLNRATHNRKRTLERLRVCATSSTTLPAWPSPTPPTTSPSPSPSPHPPPKSPLGICSGPRDLTLEPVGREQASRPSAQGGRLWSLALQAGYSNVSLAALLRHRTSSPRRLIRLD